jgi:hypothetical protein
VDQPGGSYSRAGDKRQGDKGVGDAAMMFEGLDLARKSPEDVEVGGLCGEDGSERGVCSLAIEASASDACAGQEVRNGLHGVLENIVAELDALRAVRGVGALRVVSAVKFVISPP